MPHSDFHTSVELDRKNISIHGIGINIEKSNI